MSLHETSPILFLCGTWRALRLCVRMTHACFAGNMALAKARCALRRRREICFFTGYHRLGKALLPQSAAPTGGATLRLPGMDAKKGCAGRKPRAARIAVRNVYFYCLIVLRLRRHATGIRKEPCRTCRRVRGCKHRPLSDCLHAHPEGCNKQSLQMKDPHCR